MPTPHFLLCTIINHRGAFFSPFNISWRHQKNEHRHAYLISFSTGSHKRNCQDTFRKVSIKSESGKKRGRGGHFMSDSKLLPDLKRKCFYLCKAANVLFYSLVTARMELDRPAGTLSAAVTPWWQTAGRLGSQPSQEEAGIMAAGKDVNIKKGKHAASWSWICSVRRSSMKQRLPW